MAERQFLLIRTYAETRLFSTSPGQSRTINRKRFQRIPHAKTNDLLDVDTIKRRLTHTSTTTSRAMSSNAAYNRRGAIARRTTKPSAGGAPSADFHQRNHRKSPQDHNPRWR